MNANTFILQVKFPQKKLLKILQPEFTLRTDESEQEKAILLDTFDEELRNQGQILLQRDQGMLLLDTTTGAIHSQPGKARRRCTPEIKEGPVKTALQSVSELRSFLPVTSLKLTASTRKMLDDEGKTVARMHCFSLNRKNNFR